MVKKISPTLLLVGSMVVIISAGGAFAAHPLITDDAGTQGKGGFQIELNAEYGVDTESTEAVTVKEAASEIGMTLSWGVSENADIVLGIPHQGFTVREDGARVASGSGLSDLSLEYKRRFYDKDGLSLAVKPGVSLPTGDEEKGLGTGKVSYSAFFIATEEAAPWALHFNAGYVRNEFKLREDEEAGRKDIWHVSLASQVEVAKDVNLVANIGMERNPDRTSTINPAFVLAGFIYAITGNLDLDMGVKAGLNRAETDFTVLAGIAWRL